MEKVLKSKVLKDSFDYKNFTSMVALRDFLNSNHLTKDNVVSITTRTMQEPSYTTSHIMYAEVYYYELLYYVEGSKVITWQEPPELYQEIMDDLEKLEGKEDENGVD